MCHLPLGNTPAEFSLCLSVSTELTRPSMKLLVDTDTRRESTTSRVDCSSTELQYQWVKGLPEAFMLLFLPILLLLFPILPVCELQLASPHPTCRSHKNSILQLPTNEYVVTVASVCVQEHLHLIPVFHHRPYRLYDSSTRCATDSITKWDFKETWYKTGSFQAGTVNTNQKPKVLVFQ